MTVRSFTDSDKDSVVDFYTRKFFYSNKDLAAFFGTSPRTINRILQEKGMATPVPRLQEEATEVMQLLKQYNIDSAASLKRILDSNKTASNYVTQETPVQQLSVS